MTTLADKAREALEGATPGPWSVKTNKAGNPTVGPSNSSGFLTPWVVSDENAHLIALAPDLARAVIAAEALADALDAEDAAHLKYKRARGNKGIALLEWDEARSAVYSARLAYRKATETEQ